MPLRLAAVLLLFVGASLGPLGASPKVKVVDGRSPILDTRPCGPDGIVGPLRLLIFQGCAGADFRDACRRHDLCYDTIGSDRAACDRRFLEEMLAECPKSRLPGLARFRARFAHFSVRLAGARAWRSAQQLALEKTGK